MLIWEHVCKSKLLANIQLILYVASGVRNYLNVDRFLPTACVPSFLNKIDLLQTKLESGVRFDDHVVSYRDRPNDVFSVTSCEVFGRSSRSITNLDHDTDLRDKFRAILRKDDSQRAFHCHLTSVVVRHSFLRCWINRS